MLILKAALFFTLSIRSTYMCHSSFDSIRGKKKTRLYYIAGITLDSLSSCLVVGIRSAPAWVRVVVVVIIIVFTLMGLVVIIVVRISLIFIPV